jgi:hypothetical protein
MDRKMKTLLFFITIFSASYASDLDACESYLSEKRDWQSVDAILSFYKANLGKSKPSLNIEEEAAIISGIRSFERVFDSIKFERSSEIQNDLSRVLSDSSVLDIAQQGCLIALGESSAYPPTTLKEQLNATYRSEGIVYDVIEQRRHAINDLKILLRLRASICDPAAPVAPAPRPRG